MTIKEPEDYDEVDVLIDGKWRPAVYIGADSLRDGDGDTWWQNHFRFGDDGTTFPADIHTTMTSMPEWRKREMQS